MKTAAHFKSRIAAAPASRSAFTMIEIAIALGVIGFALVAIIGILPVGLNVQRETRQDTIIGQDGPFLLEAIRNGSSALGNGTSTSLDFLTNYVESIVITNISGATITSTIYTNDPASPNYLRNGQMILSLLSTPEIYPPVYNNSSINYVTARIRALTGPAIEQNGSNSILAFRYYMAVEIVPFNSISPDSIDINTNDYPMGSIGYQTRLERAAEVPYLVNNLYELRLKFIWPVINGKPGPGRQAYRSLVSAPLLPYTNGTATSWFFLPNTYSTNTLL